MESDGRHRERTGDGTATHTATRAVFDMEYRSPKWV